jgi:uncharacterized protein (TIGR02996 family)
MTEDEAFIRTIVDRPGDDLPRLVYADWLDERDDPRGGYLRAELEWAKTKQTTGFLVLDLHVLVKGLDEVWVARVSRPPVGVCCDQLSFLLGEEPILKDAIDAVEAEFKVTLPPQYRAFLLNHNGGEPVARGVVFDTQNGRFSAPPSGWSLNPLRRSNGGAGLYESSVRGELLRRARELQPPTGDSRRSWHQRYLQIGESTPFSGASHEALILMDLTTKQFGQVWVVDGHNRDDLSTRQPAPKRFDSLSQLIATI